MSGATRHPVICLAASGGGHLRQVLDLRRLWEKHSHFVITEDTALGRSAMAGEQTEFVPHFAIGQARLGHPGQMLAKAWRSIWQSLAIIRRRRPDVVITTGAGSMLFSVLWARLYGARIILIDSFARFDRPSKFARLCGPLAHHRIAQSEAVARAWRGAELFDPLRVIPRPTTPKRDLVFATVGATLPFTRLVELVTQAKQLGVITEQVLLQTGVGGAAPETVEGLTTVADMPFGEVQATLAEARLVICHGGTGSIITALQNGCAAIVIPRLFERGEHYDNHQLEIAESFQSRGLVFLADDLDSLARAIAKARTATPTAVTTDYGPMIERLEVLLQA